MSTLVIPNSFSPGQTAYSGLIDANFTAVATTVNGLLDNSNINPAIGIYASQIIPTTNAQATFGGAGSLTWEIPGYLTIGGSGLLVGTTIGGIVVTCQIGTTATTGVLAIGLGNATQAGALYVTSGSLFMAAPNASGTSGTMQLSTNGLNVLGTIIPGVTGSGTPGAAGSYGGTGSPNGVVTAPNGSLFLRYDSTTTLYVNTSGASTSGTVWTAVTVP